MNTRLRVKYSNHQILILDTIHPIVNMDKAMIIWKGMEHAGRYYIITDESGALVKRDIVENSRMSWNM